MSRGCSRAAAAMRSADSSRASAAPTSTSSCRKEIIDGGDTVVALIDVEFTVKATGKRISEEDELHLWRFGPDGKVVRFRHGVDTHMHQIAVKP
jgi:hypothetical protein